MHEEVSSLAAPVGAGVEAPIPDAHNLCLLIGQIISMMSITSTTIEISARVLCRARRAAAAAAGAAASWQKFDQAQIGWAAAADLYSPCSFSLWPDLALARRANSVPFQTIGVPTTRSRDKAPLDLLPRCGLIHIHTRACQMQSQSVVGRASL